jgi:hypothetical protein
VRYGRSLHSAARGGGRSSGWSESRERETHINRNQILLVVAVACILVAVGDWTRTSYAAPSFVQYIGTIIATFAGVGLAAYLGIRQGVKQFRFETSESDRIRRDQLLTALASEVRASQRILSGEPTLIKSSYTNKVFGRVVLVPLPHVVVEEAARSALFPSEQTDEFFNLTGNIQVHNNEISFLFATRTGFATDEALQRATDEMKQRQKHLCDIYEALLSRIEL